MEHAQPSSEFSSTILPKIVRKRDGTTSQAFDVTKIENAVRKAWVETEGTVDEHAIHRVAMQAASAFEAEEASVEDIQDAVETALMRHRRFAVAKAYILYRQKRAEARRARRALDPSAISDYIHASKYARYVPSLLRREVYDETVARVEMMHQRRYGDVPGMREEISRAFDLVRDKRLLPSMRALSDDTQVPTPDGWSIIGQMQIGDILFDQDGHPTHIKEVLKFSNVELFDVHFIDGSVLRACNQHLWITSTLDDRVELNKTRVVSTDTIAKSLRQRSGNPRFPWKYNHAVWNAKPLQLPSRELPLDPYILGLWLGDGLAHSGQFSCHSDDAEIPAAYEAAGFPVTCPASGNVYAWGTHKLASILRTMGLRDNKHIPSIYLRSSFEQRLALLQGLMDSDGHTTTEGRSCFSNTSSVLLDGCAELLSSLGIKYTVQGPIRRFQHHKDLYEFRFFTKLIVHRLTRKRANLREDHRASNNYRTIIGVESIGRGDATCFVVDSASRTFLAGPQMIVTHNCMQFAGAAIEANHNRVYNCSFSLVDRTRVFAEAMFLLLCGCGVGYSVQFEHIDQLPRLKFINEKRVDHHVIEDTIEGWADALDALVTSYAVDGHLVEFAYNKIRQAGAPLKTSGGRAPGHVKLKAALEAIRRVLDGAQGRKLRPIECHRIMCHAAGAVLSGGIRRSAMIALFSIDDGEMMVCKTGDWWKDNREPYFAFANNSVALKRDDVKEGQFKRVFQMTREFGDPGFVFLSDLTHGVNPCAEIGMDPRLKVDQWVIDWVTRRHSVTFDQAMIGQTFTGWSFCNLCEINAAKLTSFEDFVEVARAATLIGTLQAGYTSFPYLGWVSEAIVERDALLGIGMTGMLDAPHISCNPEYQRAIAGRIKEWNADYAARIGINPAARTTCVKPSGTTSLELGSVGSGHHAHHARRYIRRVTADEYETVFQAFRAVNPHMCVRKPDGKYVIEFPVQAPDGAILKKDMTAIEFLEMVRSTQQNWVLPGTDDSGRSPGLNHNVSNTVNVASHEWNQVADYLWTHRDSFTGVSLLPEDPVLPFMPFEAVTNDDQERRFNELVAKYEPIDYLAIVEAQDGTDLAGEVACAGPGGSCSIV